MAFRYRTGITLPDKVERTLMYEMIKADFTHLLRMIPDLKQCGVTDIRKSFVRRELLNKISARSRKRVIHCVKWVPLKLFYADIAEARLNGVKI